MRPPSVKEWAPSVANCSTPLGVAASVTDEGLSMISPVAPVDGMGAILLENEEILTFFGEIPFQSEAFVLNAIAHRAILQYFFY
jgi:hypothetical protein